MSQTHGPHSDILRMGGGGPTEVHIIYPKNPNFRICLPKKIIMFLVYQKNPTPAVNCAHVIVDLS